MECILQVALTPNPWGADEKNSSAFFNQTLDLATASVLVYAVAVSLSTGAWAAHTYDLCYAFRPFAMSRCSESVHIRRRRC